MVLALGMCSISADAQTKKPVRRTTTQVRTTRPVKKTTIQTKTKATTPTTPKDRREFQVGSDGFEWYEIYKNGKYGAEDRYGNVIVPTEYDNIHYNEVVAKVDPILSGFIVWKGDYLGWYNRNGKCVIPYSRRYTHVSKKNDNIEKRWGTYYNVKSKDGAGICDRNGREVVFIPNADYLMPDCDEKDGKEYYSFTFTTKDDKWGKADAKGKVVVEPMEKEEWQAYPSDKMLQKIYTTQNPLAGNRNDTLEDYEMRASNTTPSSSQSSTTTSRTNNSNSSSSNSENKTTTVVVEHHRDPVPMQEWRACWACGGMGTMGCDGCGGSGTRYGIGDRLRTCSRCNGRGIIPCNVCYGNKGQYITVYR